jgi:hypothetical protein
MPSELRHILFRPAEVAVAVREYHRRMKTPMPPGSIVRCGVECERPGEPVRFRIAIEPDGMGAARGKSAPASFQEVVVEGPVLAASLILFCHDRRIPLPASADKALQRFGEQLGLIVTINRPVKQDEALPA